MLLLDKEVILEMKYAVTMPLLFKLMVEEFAFGAAGDLEISHRCGRVGVGEARRRRATGTAGVPADDAMPDFLKTAFSEGPSVTPVDVFIRLLVAMALGTGVAMIYNTARKPEERNLRLPLHWYCYPF